VAVLEVVRSIEIQAPPSTVWRWLASQEALRRWLRPNLEIDLRVGGTYRMLGGDAETWISGTVPEIVPKGRLVLSWLEEDAGWVHPGRLVIELTTVSAGTRWHPVTDPSDDLFRMLADPTRRRMLDLLAERGTLSVGQLAAEFPDLVPSGISKHLMALRAAGLVTATRRGRNRLYRIDADGLTRALAPWLAKYEAYWTTSLDRLRELAESPDDPESPDDSDRTEWTTADLG